VVQKTYTRSRDVARQGVGYEEAIETSNICGPEPDPGSGQEPRHSQVADRSRPVRGHRRPRSGSVAARTLPTARTGRFGRIPQCRNATKRIVRITSGGEAGQGAVEPGVVSPRKLAPRFERRSILATVRNRPSAEHSTSSPRPASTSRPPARSTARSSLTTTSSTSTRAAVAAYFASRPRRSSSTQKPMRSGGGRELAEAFRAGPYEAIP